MNPTDGAQFPVGETPAQIPAAPVYAAPETVVPPAEYAAVPMPPVDAIQPAGTPVLELPSIQAAAPEVVAPEPVLPPEQPVAVAQLPESPAFVDPQVAVPAGETPIVASEGVASPEIVTAAPTSPTGEQVPPQPIGPVAATAPPLAPTNVSNTPKVVSPKKQRARGLVDVEQIDALVRTNPEEAWPLIEKVVGAQVRREQ